jgi:hypothetical protein
LLLRAAPGLTGATPEVAGDNSVASSRPVAASSTTADPGGLVPVPACGQSAAKNLEPSPEVVSSLIGQSPLEGTCSSASRRFVTTSQAKTRPAASPAATTPPSASSATLVGAPVRVVKVGAGGKVKLATSLPSAASHT